ncbi:MAG: SIMPL domain-containing protein [Saprospiraceae bacterium]|nr:SIMPL domain-containing protein [Saprospiraceae bacterium]
MNILKSLFYAVFILISIHHSIQAQVTNTNTNNTLNVTGHGVIYLAPDVLRLNLVITGTVHDKNPKQAFNDACNEIINKLKVKDKANEGITSPYNNNQNYNNGYNNYNVNTGGGNCTYYTKTYVVTFSSMEEYERFSKAQDNFKKENFSLSCNLQFVGISSTAIHKNGLNVWEASIKNAKEKADVVIRNLGGELGKLKMVQEPAANNYNNYNYNNYSNANYLNNYLSDGKETKIPITKTVVIAYEIK